MTFTIPQQIKYNNQGVQAYQSSNLIKAKKLYIKAIRLNPNYQEAHYNLAVVYLVLHDFSQAITHFEASLKLNPHHQDSRQGLTQALLLRSKTLQTQEKFDQAIEDISNAITLEPTQPVLYYNQGIMYEQLDELNHAIKSYQKAIQLDPLFLQTYPQLYMAKRKAFDWSQMENLESSLDEFHADTPFTSLIRTENMQKNLEAAQICSSIYTSSQLSKLNSSVKSKKLSLSSPEASAKRGKSKIKIAYFSKDFRDHPIGQLIAPIISQHSRDTFEIFAISYGENDQSVYRQQIETGVDHFLDVYNQTDQKIITLLQDNHIDILIDLTGNTAKNQYCILATHPVPLQMTWLGLLGTSGTDFLDYQLTDPIVAPISEQKFYTEKLIHLPHLLPIYPPSTPSTLTRAQFNLSEDKVLLACFNQVQKITPTLFITWMTILRQIPDSILWLWGRESLASNNLRKAAQNQGIDPKRLIFFPRLPLSEHLKRAQLADLALDTTIYGGGATSAQTIQSGVPLITLQGKHYASRLTASLLNQAHLPEFITQSLQEYQSTTIHLASHPQKLHHLKSKIQNLQPNLPSFVKHLESAYHHAWSRHQKGLPPSHFSVT